MSGNSQENTLFQLLDMGKDLSILPEILEKAFDQKEFSQSVIYWRHREYFRKEYDLGYELPSRFEELETSRFNNSDEIFNDIQLLPDDLQTSISGDWNFIPLKYQGEVKGLWLFPATVSDQSKIQRAARYLGIGFQHWKTVLNFEQQNKRLDSLVATSEIFASNRDNLMNGLQELNRMLKARFGYACIAVILKKSNHLTIAAEEGFTTPDLVGKTFPIDEGITGRVFTDGEDANIPDVREDPDYFDAGEEGIRSEMAVPLRLGDRTLGVLDAQSRELDAFQDEDVELLHAIARVTAGAIENDELITSIQETKEHLTNVIDSSGDAIFVINRDGVITTWNSGAERIYGYTREEALGKHVDELVDPSDHTRTASDVIKLVEENGGIYQEDEVSRRRKSGESFPATPTYTLLKEGDEIVGLSIIEKDLTYIKQATKLNAARTLISTITHYVNNAVTPLTGRAQMAEMDTNPQNVQSLIDVSLESTQKIQDVMGTISEMKEFITTPYYNTSYILNLEEQLKTKLNDLNQSSDDE